MPLLSRRALLVGALALSLPAGRGAPAAAAAEAPLRVLAASSLTEVLGALDRRWQAAGHPPLALSVDGSNRLAQQVAGGATADLFLSADEPWMQELADKGLIRPKTRVVLAQNSLVVVVPVNGGLALAGPEGLRAAQRLALAGEGVPAGRYARASLQQLGLWSALADRVVSGANVRATLAWVAGGEAEAGVVYATDARVEPRVRVAFTLPPASHPPIRYPAAVLKSSAQPAVAAAFLALCRSSAAQADWAAAGFLPPPAQ